MLAKSIWILGLVLMLPAAAQAAGYKCTDEKGKITFSDLPCPTNASKAEQVIGRGAGSNPLNEKEKKAFKRGVMSNCTAPRNVCECYGSTMADTLTYEEMQYAMRSSTMTPSLAEKAEKAMNSCEALIPESKR